MVKKKMTQDYVGLVREYRKKINIFFIKLQYI